MKEKSYQALLNLILLGTFTINEECRTVGKRGLPVDEYRLLEARRANIKESICRCVYSCIATTQFHPKQGVVYYYSRLPFFFFFFLLLPPTGPLWVQVTASFNVRETRLPTAQAALPKCRSVQALRL